MNRTTECTTLRPRSRNPFRVSTSGHKELKRDCICLLYTSRANAFGQIARRLLAIIFLQQRPEERMVPVTAAVIANGGANRFRKRIEAPEQLFKSLVLQIWMRLERFVKVGNVGGVVLIVMNLHRLRINVSVSYTHLDVYKRQVP